MSDETNDGKPKDPNAAALGAKGGKARAKNLSPEELRSIAKKGAMARWGIRATHKGNFEKEFGINVDCYVLDDEQKTAVISQRGMAEALGLSQGGSRLPTFIRSQNMAPYVGRELGEKLGNPLVFQWSPAGANSPPPSSVHGFDVTILIDVCAAIIEAHRAGNLAGKRYDNIVKQANIIQAASAKLGIRDLVYALAGYDQTKDEVIAAFKFYVREEAREYEKEFPNQLYEQWYRIYKIPKPAKNKPWKFKDLTIKQVYEPLARSNGKILHLARSARATSNERHKKLHQFLSEIGVKALRTHLGQLLGIAQVSPDRAQYEGHVQRIFGAQMMLFDP